MKIRVLVMVLCLLMIALRVDAQDESPQWRLKTPTVNEYLTAVPTVLETWHDELPPYFGKVPNQPIVDAMLYELDNRYSKDELFAAPFQKLGEAYGAVKNAVFANPDPFGNATEWAIAILKAWLRDNPPESSTLKNIDTPVFYASVQPVDVDGDGIDEYLLDFNFNQLRNYVLLRHDTTQAGGYRVILAPLTWEDSSAYYMNDIDYSGAMLQDINGDGLLEIEILETTPSYYDFHCGRLHVLGWRDDTLAELIDQQSSFCITSPIEYVNLDSDPALEIRYSYFDSNSWGCDSQVMHTYDWNGSDYMLASEQKTTADNLGCAMYVAEPLMWENKASDAIPVYEHGIKVGWDTVRPFGPEAEIEMIQYALVRLTLAYSLAGQSEQANKLITELKNETPQSEMMAKLIQAVTMAEFNTLSLCSAAYNVFWDYQHTSFNYSLPSDIVVGRDEFVCCVGDNSPPEPEKAGCNLPPLLDAQLQSPLTTDRSPLDQLAARDIEVEASFKTDLDSDGQEEWLIWPRAHVAPIFLIPAGDHYQLSRPEVRRPNAYSKLLTQTLPDHSQVLVDWIQFDSPQANVVYYYYDMAEKYCVDSGNSANQTLTNVGSMKLWKLTAGQLEVLLDVPLCEARDIQSMFSPDSREVYGWSPQVVNEASPWNDHYGAVTYTWDTNQQMYIAPAPLKIFPTKVPGIPPGADPSSQTINEAGIFDVLRTVNNLFFEQHFTETLGEIDNALTDLSPNMLPLFTNSLHYFRGLTLETLNRPDEALAEYEAIYEAAPESAWGKLARLHLDCVKGCG